MAKKEEVRTKIDILIDAMFQVQSSLARLNTNIERQLAQGSNPQQHYMNRVDNAHNQSLGGLGQLVGQQAVGVGDPVWVEGPVRQRPEPQINESIGDQARARYRRILGGL